MPRYRVSRSKTIDYYVNVEAESKERAEAIGEEFIVEGNLVGSIVFQGGSSWQIFADAEEIEED